MSCRLSPGCSFAAVTACFVTGPLGGSDHRSFFLPATAVVDPLRRFSTDHGFFFRLPTRATFSARRARRIRPHCLALHYTDRRTSTRSPALRHAWLCHPASTWGLRSPTRSTSARENSKGDRVTQANAPHSAAVQNSLTGADLLLMMSRRDSKHHQKGPTP